MNPTTPFASSATTNTQRRHAVEVAPIAAPLITLITGPVNPITGKVTFQVASAITRAPLGILSWRDFQFESGWQCRLTGDRRTLRKVYPKLRDALVEQGSFAAHAADQAVRANADAATEDAQ